MLLCKGWTAEDIALNGGHDGCKRFLHQHQSRPPTTRDPVDEAGYATIGNMNPSDSGI